MDTITTEISGQVVTGLTSVVTMIGLVAAVIVSVHLGLALVRYLKRVIAGS